MNDENYVYIPTVFDEQGRQLISTEYPTTSSLIDAEKNQREFVESLATNKKFFIKGEFQHPRNSYSCPRIYIEK